MPPSLFDLVRPALFTLEAETAHDTSLRALESGLYPRRTRPADPVLAQTVMGLDIPNPLGIAAGYDKDARVPDALLAMGMGFAEIGTVTPLPQSGNPRPRVFRLPGADAVINRLGFNNAGHAAARERLEARHRRNAGGIVGVNIGANKDSTDRAADYVAGVRAFKATAAYFTVNVSSPNTPGLRDLQAPDQLSGLLKGVIAERNSTCPATPVIVKLAPDVAIADLPDIVATITDCGADGICISNTTLTRPGVSAEKYAGEAGGLSGAPLFQLSTAMLARVHELTEGAVPLIGVGGITSGATALAKIEAGASLIQLYTGLIYKGPGLIGEITTALSSAVRQAGATSVRDLVGRDATRWSAKL